MILNIIPPASMLADLGAEPGDRIFIDKKERWHLYEPRRFNGAPHPGLVKRTLTASEVEALLVTAGDIWAHQSSGASPAQADRLAADWLRYGITRPDFLRWTSRGLYEPAVVADLIASGVDPDSQRDLVTEHAEALNDGDMSVAEFVALCWGAQ